MSEMYFLGLYAKGEADKKSDLDFSVQSEDDRLIEGYFKFLEELKEEFNTSADVIFIENMHKLITRFKNRFASPYERDKVSLL